MTYRSPIVFLALVLLWGPALAHHSTSIYMTDDLRSITGVVTEYEWRNPHTYIQLEVTTLDGQKYLRDIEAGAISWLRPLGLSANSLDVGDQITVRAFPPRRPRSEIYLGRELITEDGRVLPLNSLSPFIEGVSSTGTTSDIAGIWVMENDAWEVFEQEQRSSWALTDAGRAAIARHDGVATPQAECVPMSVPHLMLYPVVAQFSIEQSTQAVQIRVDWMKSERTIYLDGRDHPPSSESFLFGHSVGRWEGDTEGVSFPER